MTRITDCQDESSLVGRFTYSMLDIMYDMAKRGFTKREIRKLLVQDIDNTLNDQFIEIERELLEERMQWVRLKSLAYCVKTKEEIENPRSTLNSAQLGDISQDNTSPIMLISRFWDN